MSDGVSGPEPSALGPPPHLGTSEPPEGGDRPSFATRYALAQKAGGHRRPAAHRLPRLPDRGRRRPDHDGQQPDQHVQGDLRGRRAELVHRGRLVRDPRPVHRRTRVVPVERQRHRVDGRVQPAADADQLRPARAHRARRRLRVPVRHVQHRRPGPVPRRRDHGRLDRLRRCPASRASSTSSSRSIGGRARRRGLGRDRRLPQGDGRDARGDLDDHAQLDRDLDRRLPVRARRAAPERHAALRAGLERRRRGGEAADLLGRPVPAGAPRRLLRRARRPRRLLDHAQPDDARLRGAGGRLQPRGRPLRRHLGRAQLLPRDGDLGRLRRARRRDRHRRLGLPDQHERRLDLVADRLRRDRGRAARPQQGDRDRPVGAPVRVARDRDLDPQPRPGDLPARAGVEPDGDDPGSRRPLRRRRRADPLAVRPAQAATAAASRGGTANDPLRQLARRPSSEPRARVDRHPLRPDRLLGRAAAAEGAHGACRSRRDRAVRDHAAGSTC